MLDYIEQTEKGTAMPSQSIMDASVSQVIDPAV